MAYVEFLWTRRMFAWFAGIAAILGILIVGAAVSVPGHVHIGGPRAVPFGSVFSIAGYATCIMATMISATLNRDREHLAYLWTRPIPRIRIALTYFLVDVATLVVAFAVVAVVAAFVMSNLRGLTLVADPNAGTTLLRFIALPLMWYAVVEAVTSWNGLKGPAAGGISWAVFWGLLILAAVKLPAPFMAIVAVLNIFNPLAYFISNGHSTLLDPVTLSEVNGRDLIPMDYGVQTVLAYAIFLGGCAFAAYAWKRMEA
ncbi:MAG: hypothetical protein JO101_00170 [Candidatus Eremiobacteraeota bacterium]|nr:hypothetical protein [Candidatus Eremiobacteraeota bacterium]MBV8353707.1 hypothetical protein [Candidatus Eremiobacteraeota bacterium]